MEQVREIKKELWRAIKTPESTLFSYYADLFKRNQNKWMKRSPLKVEDLEMEFQASDEGELKTYILSGSVSPKEMLISCKDDGKFYIVHSDEVDYLILGGKRKR